VDALIDLVSHAPDGLAMDAVRLGGTAASTLGAADEQVLAGRRGHRRPGAPDRRQDTDRGR